VHRQIVQSIPLDDADIECLIQERRGEVFDHAGHQRPPAETLARDDGGQHRRDRSRRPTITGLPLSKLADARSCGPK
jgi:hypothetical protein